MKRNSESLLLTLLSLTVLAVFIFLDLRHTDIIALQYYSIDEYSFQHVLYKMHDGIRHADVRNIFQYTFYSYGFSYFFITDLLAFPFLYTHNYELAIVIPRLLSSVAAVLALVYSYKILRLYVSAAAALILTALLLTFPGFWLNGSWFHPDVLMTTLLIIAVYYFCKDLFAFKRNYWLGVLFFSEAIAIKLQAFTFLPLLLLILFHEEVTLFSFARFGANLWRAVKTGALLIGVFLLNNPFLLHPKGLRSFAGMFAENMQSNSTNHFSKVPVTITDKIHLALHDYYLLAPLLALLMLGALLFILKHFRDQKYHVLYFLVVALLVNVVYLFLFVQKTWQHYYLTIGFLWMLTGVFLYLLVPKKWMMGALVLLVLLNAGFHIPILKNEFSSSYAIDTKPVNASMNSIMRSFIQASLPGNFTASSKVLLSHNTCFDFRRLGIPFENVRYYDGALNASDISKDAFLAAHPGVKEKYFFAPDILIINKTEDPCYSHVPSWKPEFDCTPASQATAEALRNGTAGYRLLAENEYLILYRLP